MIPLPVVPLKGVAVLVTRPAEQSEALCKKINDLGGDAIRFPTIAIEAIAIEENTHEYDWVIFVSANAVQYGLGYIKRGEHTRIAAIGKATAAALEARNVRVDATPIQSVTSEALLAHPALATIATQSVLIAKGVGGRELLYDSLTQRGAHVAILDVYRRVPPTVSAESVAQLERRWHDEGIDIVTLTSVESLDNLQTFLTDAGRALLASTPFVALSERIAAAARTVGLYGCCVLSRSADDESIVGAIAAWHMRAR